LAEKNSFIKESGKGEFVFTRVLDAPRELVWKTLTESEHLNHWWGPKGFTTRVTKLNLRPGGVFHYWQRSPEGREIWGKWVYREIVPPELLVVINSFSDEEGNVTRNPFSPTWPLECLTTSTFSEHGGKTTLTIRSVPHNATEVERKTFVDGLKSMDQGFTGTLDRLAEHLANAMKGQTR
jgi:uncharacterized protein YndB with AHSA1/START domain